MRTWVILILLLTAFWFGISWRWYTCGVKGFCGEENKYEAYHLEKEREEAEKQKWALRFKELGPIVFKYGKSIPNLNENTWEAYLDSLLALGGDMKRLNINGLWMKGETESIGLDRAKQLRDLLGDKLDDARVRLGTTQVLGKDLSADSLFRGVNYIWEEISTDIGNTEKVLKKITVYFPYNSASAELDPGIRSGLADIIAYLKEEGKEVSIVGHTDSDGDAERNKELGFKRAEMIQSYFASQGLDDSQMNVWSEGEAAPIASNNTDSGKAQNRRVELIFE